MKKISLLLLSLLSFAFSAFAEEENPMTASVQSVYSTDPSTLKNNAPYDPFESINRPIFAFNQFMDKWFFIPAAKIYNTLLPKPVRVGSTNFFDNLSMISATANDLLQGEINQSMNDIWRFIINSTLGAAGTIDVASHFGLPKHFNDMGITFAKWGAKKSPYIMIPLLGPSTVRDGVGLLGDYYLFTFYPYIKPESTFYAVISYRFLNIKAQTVDANIFMNTAALDPYTFMRDAYFQYRNNKIGGESTSQYLYLEENEPQDLKPGIDYVPEEPPPSDTQGTDYVADENNSSR